MSQLLIVIWKLLFYKPIKNSKFFIEFWKNLQYKINQPSHNINFGFFSSSTRVESHIKSQIQIFICDSQLSNFRLSESPAVKTGAKHLN